MTNNNDEILIKKVKEFITNNNQLLKIFTHHKIKYSIDELLKNILIILKTGISYRDIQKYTTINWNTIYKFNLKLTKYNIFERLFNKTIDNYLNEMKNTSTTYFTDTAFICNKLGEDLVSNNPQIKKHKTSKISIISDDFNIPLSIKVDTGVTHDSTILKEQLIDFNKKHPHIFNQTNILIADGAYDSIPLQQLIKKLNLKKLITNKNIRNLKDKIKIDKLKISLYDKMLLRKRICVEHMINKFKKFKRIQLRYDRYIENFKSFIFTSALLIIIKNTRI
jgi:transposase